MAVEDHFPLCGAVARSFARSYPPVEAEDVEQELALFLWEQREHLADAEAGYVRVALNRKATIYCQKERAARLHFDDRYFYRPDDVREMLPAFFGGPECWAEVPGPEDGKHTYDSGQVIYHDDKANGLSAMADISRVFGDLSERHAYVLSLRHDLGLDFEGIAERLDGAGKSTGHMAESRAVDALCDLLNKTARQQSADHDGPGSRQAITNAKAQAITKGYE